MKTNHKTSTSISFPVLALIGTMWGLCASVGRAAPAVYYDETAYLNALAALGYPTITESFESATWELARQSGGWEGGIMSQGIGWAAGDAIKVGGFERTGTNGVYNTGGTPDHVFGASSLTPLIAVGGWFRGTSATNLFFVLDSGSPIAPLDLAYFDFHFAGVIDTAGFNSFLLSTTSGNWGADDFTLVVRPRALAPTPARLGLQLYAGLSVTGVVGTVYSVECVTDLSQTNNTSAWRCLEFVQLPATPYLWSDKSAPATGKRFYRAVEFAAPANLVFIPPGTFRMGSPTNEVGRFDPEGPQTAVTISSGYWMGKYEVTQAEYLAVMGSNPSYFSTNYGYAEDLSRPVDTVSWSEATNFCALLTQRERAAGRIASNCTYRLPTEAEWEYASRGWTSTRFNYGDDPDFTDLTNYAWYFDNGGHTTHPVGQKLPNPWGLYDMYGNLSEWCRDWRADYTGGIALDPQGPVSGSYRVTRGGDWDENARNCRSASRSDRSPEAGYGVIGFRVVLAPGQP